MTESCYWDEPLDDVEAMVRSAGEYVRASDDLRPRVLEAARMQCGEQRTRRRLGRVAMFVVLLAFFTAVIRQESKDQPSSVSGMLASAGFDESYSLTQAATTRSGDGDWRMIEAFTKLRRQQAQVLRLAI